VITTTFSRKPAVAASPDTPPLDRERVAATKQKLVEAGVEFCVATFCDVHGVPKAKVTPISAFEKMCAGKELYTVGALEGMGLVGPHEDECATVPDLDSMVICPWDRRQAWFTADLYYHGKPYANDPRGILKRVLAKAERMGFTFNLGIEPEFYVYRKDAATGRYSSTTATHFGGPNACYDYNLTDESLAFLEPMARYLTELDWGLFSFDQECGRGQYEFGLGYADAATMSDRFIFLRTMAKKVAQQIDAVAAFMPKPFADDFRSGAHFNMSLADSVTGENRFVPDPEEENPFRDRYGVELSQLGYHFAAGILRHANAITAMICPTYNSYQGLIARGELREFSWAPVLIAYGSNNRSAMLRCPVNRYCVENRAVDISVNPYLAAAVTLAAGLEGIEQELDPGAPINQDIYKITPSELESRGLRRLPPTLLHALEAFGADELMKDTLGSYHQVYLDQKRREWDQAFYRVSDEQRRDHLEYI
jgi:glutamine synthetase